MDAERFPLLANLENPLDIQRLSDDDLTALAQEARSFLIESISKTGGHLGAALGVVELTIALFHQFNFLEDRIAWDVGHQAHIHKLFTGRAALFPDYGLWGGMSKFLERKESPYDHMGAGHASTSISSALGMAVARDVLGQNHHVIAVIGDGAMTGGLAYEALSMAGELDLNLTVILNDNGMSIDKNVGAVSRTVTRITSSDSYNAIRDELKSMTRRMPFGTEILKSLKHMERSVKDYASPDVAAMFESLNFRYFGPVDGHNVHELIAMLGHAKTMQGPLLIRISTVKGKGMGPDIENTFAAHAVSPPKSKSAAAQPQKSWTNIYSEGMADLMARDSKVVAITAAMLSNTGLAPLKEKYPDRVLDVGIAEANGYCGAAGLAIGGIKPFVTIYSTFSQRAIDQIIHDIALQNLPVRIMMDRGGFVGSDGPTHHGVFDFSYLRMIPGMVHMAPCNELEMRRMMRTAYEHDGGPIAMRFARGDTPAMDLPLQIEPILIGQGELLRPASQGGLLLAAVGSMVPVAEQVAEELESQGVDCAVINARFIKPLDEALLSEQIGKARGVITLEENVLSGGFGEAVLCLMAHQDLQRPARLLGAPDQFVSYGGQRDQLEAAGLTASQVLKTALDFWRGISGAPVRRRKRLA
ncbi:MAG: 1-deoxy-D-xylulose-5-phosphate synthase [SAR324 cluster bacterium]|nr:1-deoxy-D-xylulose-5-phosphate synthase [SAR324 cluster bacterium]